MNTGKHSLNSRIRGEVRALCEQSKEKITPEKMYRRIKEIAMLENGLPSEEKRIKIKKKQVEDTKQQLDRQLTVQQELLKEKQKLDYFS